MQKQAAQLQCIAGPGRVHVKNNNKPDSIYMVSADTIEFGVIYDSVPI
jgi:hypothetical protein